MSLVTSLYNKVQYIASKQLSDPNADAYARERAAQLKQEEETQRRADKAAAKQAVLDAKAAEDANSASNLASRSKFDSNALIGDTAKSVLSGIGISILVILILYGGNLAANQAMGYKNPFRILSFIYGCLAFFYVIPRSLYLKYGKGESLPMYAFLPLSIYVPSSDINVKTECWNIFCYQEDEISVKARSAIESMYSKVHAESLLPQNPT